MSKFFTLGGSGALKISCPWEAYEQRRAKERRNDKDD